MDENKRYLLNGEPVTQKDWLEAHQEHLSRSPALLYACIVTDCWESWQESLHRTKAGAWKAGRKWLVEQFNSDYEKRAMIGKHTTDFMPGYQSFKVRPVEVKE
jgi:hypothetical protein